MRKWEAQRGELICPGSQSKKFTGQNPEPSCSLPLKESIPVPVGVQSSPLLLPRLQPPPPTLPLSCYLEPHLTFALLYPKSGNPDLAGTGRMCQLPTPPNPTTVQTKDNANTFSGTTTSKCLRFPDRLVINMQMSGSFQFIDSWAWLFLATFSFTTPKPHPRFPISFESVVPRLGVSQTCVPAKQKEAGGGCRIAIKGVKNHNSWQPSSTLPETRDI